MDEPNGKFANQNRKFLPALYRPAPTELFMKLAPPDIIAKPVKYDLRLLTGPIEIYNQGGLGSCTANAIAGAYKIMSIIKYRKSTAISRLFVYYNERKIINQINVDSGAFIKDGFTSMQTQGACLEMYWPYVESQFAVQPTPYCYNEAKKHQSSVYNSQLDPRTMVQSIKQCLMLNLPVVIGIMVYESFESNQTAQTGLVPYPNVQTEKLLGGHALCCVGYDDTLNHFVVLNSWGNTWGDQGYCYIPYAYIANNDLCSDCHAFLNVELKMFGDDKVDDKVYDKCINFKQTVKDACNVV